MGHGFSKTVLESKVLGSAKTLLYGLTIKFSTLLYTRGDARLALPVYSSLCHWSSARVVECFKAPFSGQKIPLNFHWAKSDPQRLRKARSHDSEGFQQQAWPSLSIPILDYFIFHVPSMKHFRGNHQFLDSRSRLPSLVTNTALYRQTAFYSPSESRIPAHLSGFVFLDGLGNGLESGLHWEVPLTL